MKKVIIKDSELQKIARTKLSSDPDHYFDFLGEIRESITESQMIMLIDIHDEFRERKRPHTLTVR